MRRTVGWATALALVVGVAAAGATVPSPAPPSRPTPAAPSNQRNACDLAVRLAADLIANGPGDASQADQSRVLQNAIACELRANRLEPAYVDVQLMARLTDPSVQAFALRLTLAFMLHHDAEGVAFLEDTIARKPQALAIIDPDVFLRVYQTLTDAGDRPTRLRLLTALDRVNYQPPSPFAFMDSAWAALAGELAGAGDAAGARRVLARVREPDAVAQAVGDQRLAAIIREHPDRYAPAQVRERWLITLHRLVAANPNLLEGPVNEARHLLNMGRAFDALTVLDAAQARSADPNAVPFSDRTRWLNWVFDMRGTVLINLGRIDEGLAAYRTAATMTERGGSNVSNVLNYVSMANEVGRPELALEGLGWIPEAANASPFGAVVLHTERICALSQLNRLAEARASIVYVTEHENDNPAAAGAALLCASDMDAAARHYLRRLANPDLRAAAMRELLAGEARTWPVTAERARRAASLAGRPDIAAAMVAGQPPLRAADLPGLARTLTAGDQAGVYVRLRAVIGTPAAADWSPADQHRALALLATAAHGLRRFHEAVELTTRLTAAPLADAADFKLMANAAIGAEDDHTSALVALTSLARRFPHDMADVEITVIGAAWGRAPANAEGQRLRFELAAALYETGWRISDPNQSADTYWTAYMIGLMQRGDLAGARRVLAVLNTTGALVELRIDRRFDPLTTAEPARFDLLAAKEAEITRLRRQSAAHPDNLQPVVNLIDAIDSTGRFDEALRLADATIARRDAAGGRPFTDDEDQTNWLHQMRADVLVHLGRFDEALQEMQVASRTGEGDGDNASQRLNRGGLLVRLGRPQEALAQVETVPDRLSPYGHMVLIGVRLCAHHQLGHIAEAAAALEDMRAHRDDAPAGYLDALICMDDRDGAAAALIAQLREPATRVGALRFLQHWRRPATRPPHARLMSEREDAIAARPDVRAAIDAVGRIEEIPLY